MTETKYIFPKQPQSVTVLVFITVLIVLLLVLTVMVHMRTRKLKSMLETRFLATMSQDIRTPLNGIIGMVNMGNQYADDPQMQKKIREKVMESLKYLVSLVNDVLDMNKLQSGDLKDQQLLFDLTVVLRELNQIYDEQAAKKGIRYEID